MNKRLAITASVLAVLITGCGGGGTAATPSVKSAAAAATGSATMQLTIPLATAVSSLGRARPQYVSSATASVTIKQGATLLGTFNTSAASPGCSTTAMGVQCSFSIAPAVGVNQVFTVTAYAQANAAGPELSAGSTTATIVASANTTISVTMGGQVASIALTFPSVPAGTPTSAPFVVLAKDAAGATIIGPGAYSSPITLSVAANGGIVSLAANGGAPAASIQIASPADVATISYSGANVSFAAITATTTPPGGSAVAFSTYFGPTPTIVATRTGTFPNATIYSSATVNDTRTRSFWFGVHDNVTNNWSLVQVTPSGVATEVGVNHVGSSPYAIVPNGPNGLVWYSQAYRTPVGYGSYDPVTQAATLYSDASNQNCYVYNVFPGAAGQPVFYGSGYCNNNTNTIFALDATIGNVDAQMTAGQSTPVAVGGFLYASGGSNLLINQVAVTGTPPALTFTPSGQAAFQQPTISTPTAAADGTLWDAFGCTFVHTVPATPFSATAAAYFPLPANTCTASQQFSVARRNAQSSVSTYLGQPFFAPDGSVWSYGNGFIVGMPQSATSATVAFSTAAIPLITASGVTVPFAPSAAGIAPNGNLLFLLLGNNNTQVYITEVAY